MRSQTHKRLETLRPTSWVAGLTVCSRILGLLRDSLLFSALGASGLNSAFLLAFTLPNLFRRLLGEGALTTALIPALVNIEQDPEALEAFVNQVLTRLLLLLLATTGLLATWLVAIGFIPGLPQRWYWAASMGIVLLPYLLFVCLTAALSAVLNSKERFKLGAVSPVWLNLCMIGALGLGLRLPEGPIRAWLLCAGVLIGGVLQTSIVAWACWQHGLRLRLDWRHSKALKHWLTLFLPGLWGASVLQLNIVVSRLLAFSVDASATAILYLANRLIELPLGIFTMAIASVIFPRLSRHAAQKDDTSLAKTYQKGLSWALGVTIPAALGLIVLSEPILIGLFQWGAFEDAQVAQVPLCFFAASIPFYSISILATRALHALGQARLPARMALYTLGLNLILSLLLLPWGATSGLAAANLLATMIQSLLLHHKLCCLRPTLASVSLFQPRVWVCSALMGGFTHLGWRGWSAYGGASKASVLTALPCLVALGVALYAALLWMQTQKKKRPQSLFSECS